jgi:hypothetical protein
MHDIEKQVTQKVLVTWYELIHCKIWFDGNGQKHIAHPVLGYFSTRLRAYNCGRSLGCRYLPHEEYWRSFEKQHVGEAFFIIPQYVVLTSPSSTRGWLACDVYRKHRTEVELDQ